MEVIILGAGNVATQLALALRKAEHTIVQVYNRSGEAGDVLAKTVGASFTSDARQLLNADVYLIAVKDDAIADLASQLKLEQKVVAHTSGSKTKELLSFSSSNYGIFYPLQTMTKLSKVDFSDVPVLLEANNDSTLLILEELANSISRRVYNVGEEQRQWIHVAAVFANNFSNHMFTLSQTLLEKHGLDFEILKPLILRSVENLKQYSPSQLQTGPAVRKDKLTIDKHLELLTGEAELQKLYKEITDSIIRSRSER
jgi:predicted short-subunit dehydrogenase-like oxidoreductase (DUF2520 family)